MSIDNNGDDYGKYEQSGWIVSGIMTSFAYVMEVRDPLSLTWVLFTARFVYGADRYWDGKTIHHDSIESILFALCVSVFILYSKNMMLWSIPEVLSLCMYPHFKESCFSSYKCAYVGLCWTLATCVLPQMMQSTDVSLLNGIGLFLLFTGMSNLSDIIDMREDQENNINTVPVVYGKRKAIALSLSLLTSSALSLFYTNKHDDEYIQKNHIPKPKFEQMKNKMKRPNKLKTIEYKYSNNTMYHVCVSFKIKNLSYICY